MPDLPLNILHLSDIHLRKSEIESPADLDADIRNELTLDLTGGDLPIEGGVHAVVVTGDLAFAGDPVEFDNARSWLLSLCETINCPPEQIWVVPGNHDVDRGAVDRSSVLRAIHHGIRDAERPSSLLHEHLCEPAGAQLLLSPLQAYNRFAEQFRSDSSFRSIAWVSSATDLVLNDGSSLRIRGLNSALVSDRNDNDTTHKLVLGLGQLSIQRQPGVVWMTLCHHPPRWLADDHEVADYLDSRVAIQLFGHEHRLRVQRHDNGIRVYAGALHPSRDEPGWHPKYNLLRVAVDGSEADRTLVVDVFEREWKREQTMFGPAVGGRGQSYPRNFRFSLPAWSPPPATVSEEQAEAATPDAPAVVEENETLEDASDADAPKRLVFQFFEVPYPARIKLLAELGLVREADVNIRESELLRRVVARARDADSLHELQAAIVTNLPKNDEAP